MIKKYLFLATTLFIAYRYFTAPPPGFCVTQNRFLPNEQFIAVTEKIFNSYTKRYDGKTYPFVNCCVVRKIEADFLAKIFRVDAGVWVSFAYKKGQKEVDASNDKQLYGWSGYNFDSCGAYRNWDEPYGLPAVYIEGDGKSPPNFHEKDQKDFIKWPR